MTRRQVRAASSFDARLDELLPSERAVDGSPSVTDFLEYELPAIVRLLEIDYEANTVPGAEPTVRRSITAGTFVRAVAVRGVAALAGG